MVHLTLVRKEHPKGMPCPVRMVQLHLDLQGLPVDPWTESMKRVVWLAMTTTEEKEMIIGGMREDFIQMMQGIMGEILQGMTDIETRERITDVAVLGHPDPLAMRETIQGTTHVVVGMVMMNSTFQGEIIIGHGLTMIIEGHIKEEQIFKRMCCSFNRII